MSYHFETIDRKDRRSVSERDALLHAAHIKPDPRLDYCVGMYDEDETLVATGGLCFDSVRCLAVKDDLQGEGLMASLMAHLVNVAAGRGYRRLYLCTKPANKAILQSLGFYEIASLPELVFMENRKNGFTDWLNTLPSFDQPVSAVVMHANPFTLGHRFLLEESSKQSEKVLCFVLSDNSGPIPYEVRKRLVEEGTAGLSNVSVVPAGPYLISRATFPSYFLQSDDDVIRAEARLDAAVFSKIASKVGISARFVGEEPKSRVTAIYNEILSKELPSKNVRLEVVERLAVNGAAVSASTVRSLIHEGRTEAIRDLVPETTLRFFLSEEGATVVKALRDATDVLHY